MAKKIDIDVYSESSIQNAINELQAYKRSLNFKCEELCRRLVDEGCNIISVRIGNSGYRKYIHIDSKVTPTQYGCKALLFMEDASKIVSQWKTEEGIKTSTVSPIMMIEFGSGIKAENPVGIPGVGTGTFPGGTHGNEPGWWYMDMDDKWHYSTGISPKMPMYYAGKELREKVLAIAKDVFKS